MHVKEKWSQVANMSALEKDTPPIEYPDPGKYMLKAQVSILRLSKQKPKLQDCCGQIAKDLGISYNFAAGIMQMLEQSGWISEPNNLGERKLLLR